MWFFFSFLNKHYEDIFSKSFEILEKILFMCFYRKLICFKFYSEQNDRPVPPFGLRIAWNHGRRVNITWNWSSVRHNGERITDPVTFTVNYVSIGNASVWTSVLLS